MSSLEERIAYLEGKIEDQSVSFEELRRQIGGLGDRISRLEARVDEGFAQIERRLTLIEGRFTVIEGRITHVDEKMDRHFMWIVGMQFGVLFAVVGALVGSYYR